MNLFICLPANVDSIEFIYLSAEAEGNKFIYQSTIADSNAPIYLFAQITFHSWWASNHYRWLQPTDYKK